ncbi:MAG: hypothetical protein KDI09_22375, partial [Halioglobus sp.]|nr:hypothetical protein [Halioglobus sp.]
MSKLTVTSNKHNDAAKRVREAYRASRNVRTPERLNLAVLEKARAAIKPGFAAFPPAWARPLAFAATLLLGVAVVYEMRGAGPLPPSLAPREAPRTAPVANG